MGALVIDIKLDIGEIHHIQLNGARVLCHQLRQVHHLLLGPLAGIGRRMEIGRLQGHAALGHHVPCHRAVDAAGKQEHGLPGRSDGHSPGTRDGLGKDIDLMAHLHPQENVRVMHVHPGLRIRV